MNSESMCMCACVSLRTGGRDESLKSVCSDEIPFLFIMKMVINIISGTQGIC